MLYNRTGRALPESLANRRQIAGRFTEQIKWFSSSVLKMVSIKKAFGRSIFC